MSSGHKWWSQIRGLVGPTGKVITIPSKRPGDGRVIEIKCSCLTRPPGLHPNHPGRRFRVRAELSAALDQWAVHLEEHHPDVETPILTRLDKGARERVQRYRDATAAEETAAQARWNQMLADAEAEFRSSARATPSSSDTRGVQYSRIRDGSPTR